MDDSDHSDLFASPSNTPERIPPHSERPKTPANQNSKYNAAEAREAAMRKELDGVRNINELIEGVLGTLERAKGNMGTVSKTVDNASTLLNTWTRILSQTEHNQRLILDPNWKGATQDMIDIESETLNKQQESERRAAEAERRREEARRKAEEDERQRPAAASVPARGARGTRSRGRGITRGASSQYGTAGSTGTGTGTTSSSIGSTRGYSGIGRGIGGSSSRAGTGRSRGAR